MESMDLATTLFNLLGCHYIFNLSYHTKLNDFMRFLQEKIAGIPADDMKWKSAVSATHVNGISAEYEVLKREEERMDDSDSDDN